MNVYADDDGSCLVGGTGEQRALGPEDTPDREPVRPIVSIGIRRRAIEVQVVGIRTANRRRPIVAVAAGIVPASVVARVAVAAIPEPHRQRLQITNSRTSVV